MEENLKLTPSLFDFNGVIGRRDLFLNFLYLCMITSPLWLPAMACLAIPKALDMEWALITISILATVSLVVFCLMFLPSLIKRLNDLNGKVDKQFNVIYSVCFYLSIVLPIYVHGIFSLVFIGFMIHLFGKKGVITGKLPHDIIKTFNWGAYFGTWIWGLFNKSYNTLWMIPLSITPLGFIYQLICGIRGNEWAAKNKDWASVTQFKESQETQTVVFAILQLVVFPIVLTGIIVAMVFGIIFKTFDEGIKEPKKAQAGIEKLENALSKMESLYFESHVITEDENKFYISPNTWNYTAFSERKDMLDFAANLAASERRKNRPSNSYESFSKTTELPRTKIYNIKNDEILAEFYMDESIYTSEQVNFKDVLKASFKAYKFYEPSEK